ncbi:MAG: mycofactocin system GMC family oxidoreductase MftG [Mycobacterium sp.]
MTAPVRHADVLVVGAGSAGSVVAEQLSVDPDCRVLVVEAGVGLIDPALSAQAGNGLELPLGATSTLVRRYRGKLTGQPQRWTTIMRGATVGGSGAVNGGYFCRGLPRDFDDMALPGWTWPEVLGNFRAIETDLDFGGPAHGDSGPIPIRRSVERAGSTEQFIIAAQRAGFGWIADLNDPDSSAQPGVGAVPLNIVDGVRTGPGAAYLLPALARSNLSLLTGTRAVRVAMAAGRAVGLQAVGPDGPVRLVADRIVLCAGSIESAHLLMLSGIGDPGMLRGLGVEVLAGLPVGASFADHPEWVVPVDWPATPGRPVLEAVLHTGYDVEIRPYTTGFAAMVGDAGDGADGRPDRPQIGVALMAPRSRGRLTLVSVDPRVPPRIEYRYDSEPDDIAALRAGVQLVGEIVGAAAQVGSPAWSTSQHLCGTVPMGADTEPGSVLDTRCRVRGIEGLWVVDGSVLPRITSRGPHASVVMLAHRAAQWLRG